jgi:hypothetical protein
MRARPLGLLLLAGAIGAGAWSLHTGSLRIPDRYNPWAALAIDEPLGWLTRWKLARLGRDAGACRALLATAEWKYTPLPDRVLAPGCGFTNAVQVRASSVAVGAGFTLTCPAAVALALWERQVMQPAARASFGQPVVRIEHFGAYACRNLYGRSDAPRSRHATADALDIAGFVLADGRRLGIARHWRTEGGEALFLRELHAGACRVFDAVLGPDYNAAHADHFHLERGGGRVCR